MKRDRIDLGGWMSVESGLDTNGRYYIGYARDMSFYFRCGKELRKFLKLPAGTASRQNLDEWLTELAMRDEQRKPKQEDNTEELLATGFGPECHLDEADPNYMTRTVI
jgi:hypothetical protein